MWPDRGSGFEPSYYSPSGELLQGARFRRNLLRDPKGIGRAVRGSWGLWILAGGIVLIIVIALVSLVLS